MGDEERRAVLSQTAPELSQQFPLIPAIPGHRPTRLELVTGILILPQRQTALVAKQTAEVDVLSKGRLRLALTTYLGFLPFTKIAVERKVVSLILSAPPGRRSAPSCRCSARSRRPGPREPTGTGLPY